MSVWTAMIVKHTATGDRNSVTLYFSIYTRYAKKNSRTNTIRKQKQRRAQFTHAFMFSYFSKRSDKYGLNIARIENRQTATTNSISSTIFLLVDT